MNDKNTAQPSVLTAEQQQALNRFAVKHGRTWRAKLRALWNTGKDERVADGAYLRQIRNENAACINSFVPAL